MDRLDCDRMFVAVLETGSFARAAARLGTSAGQASKLVSRLETTLGVRLLSRTTRSLSATEIGQAYYERIQPLLAELDAIDVAVKNASGAASGRIRLTAPLSFGTGQLTEALLDFARAYPDIQLDVGFTDRIVSLVDEGFDAAVRVGRPVDSSLIVRKLCDARVVLAAAPAYLAEHGTPLRPEDLAGHECIIDTNFREPLNWHFRAAGQTLVVTVAGRLHFSNAEACLTAAEHGLGIARLPSFVAGPSLAAGRTVPLLLAYEDDPFGIFTVYPPGRHLARKVRVLIDFLVARYRDGPPWDQGW